MRGVLGLALALGLAVAAQAQTRVDELSHIHGLAVDPAAPGDLLVATHHGLYRARPDGTVDPVSATRDDFMGFTPHPSDPGILYASGHPAGGGNLGLIVSRDGGRSWDMLAPGVGGPVDFHAMDVSRADPDVIYGVYRGIQVSRDGGRSFEMAGPVPAGLIDIAAGAVKADTLYAATEHGLLMSPDSGRHWRNAYLPTAPVSVVATGPDGKVYAYVLGVGLIRADEGQSNWETLGALPPDDFLLHLAVAPDALYGVTRSGRIVASTDDGRSWVAFGAR